MQEEVTQKTVALVFRAARLTADVLQKAMEIYLSRRSHDRKAAHGKKMSIKELVGQGAGASSIEVTERNIKSFERTARKYNVDFAVKKDKGTKPPKYIVFFKGRDADVITQAFREYVNVNERKRGRVSIQQEMEEDGKEQKENGKEQEENGKEQKENGKEQKENGKEQKENGKEQKENGKEQKENGIGHSREHQKDRGQAL